MHKQQINGSISSRDSRRKAKNRKKKPISEHTKNFRALFRSPVGNEIGRQLVGHSAPVRVKPSAAFP